MVNSVAVERQAISRRGERESSGGGKKERKGRKKERMDCFVRFRDERVKAKGKRGRGPDAPRGACATCVFPRRLFHRFNRRVPSFPPAPRPPPRSSILLLFAQCQLARPRTKVRAVRVEGEKVGRRANSVAAALPSPFGRDDPNERNERVCFQSVRIREPSYLRSGQSERRCGRKKALSLTGQRNFSIEFF